MSIYSATLTYVAADLLVCDGEEADGFPPGPVGDMALPIDVIDVVHDAYNFELVICGPIIPSNGELAMPDVQAARYLA